MEMTKKEMRRALKTTVTIHDMGNKVVIGPLDFQTLYLLSAFHKPNEDWLMTYPVVPPIKLYISRKVKK